MFPSLAVRLRRAVAALLVIGVASTLPHPAFGASEEVDEAVAGRLGGTPESFVARFGDPVRVVDVEGPVYPAEGFGYFTVEHNPPTSDTPNRGVRITVSSPRPPELAATEPDPADWSIAEATDRVRMLLPTDAELTDFSPAEDGQLTATCSSDALAELFALDRPPHCRVTLVLSAPETVSYATLAVIQGAETGEAQPPTAGECTGVLEWIKAAGDRLTRTQNELSRVRSIDETDPAAVETLRELAETFRGLAAEQRGSKPPEVAAQANFYLVSALTAYAKAIETAADGLEAGDAAMIDDAVAAFEGAGTLVAKATGEIEEAGTACALELGTPVVVASPDAG